MVLSMQVVLPTGEIIRTPPVPKHAAGPDWFRLFLGAEGNFGIITEATMQLDYLPEARLMRAVLFDDLNKALGSRASDHDPPPEPARHPPV